MKWFVGIVAAAMLVGCQREICVHLSPNKEVRKASPTSMPEAQVPAPIEKVEAVVEPIVECEELIVEKTEEIEQDVEIIREKLGDDAKKVEVELNRIKLNAGIIKVRCFIIEQLLVALKKVLTEFPTTSHVVVSENKIVTYTNVSPTSKPVPTPKENTNEKLIVLLVIIVVVLCGIVISLVVTVVNKKNKERIKKVTDAFEGKNVVSSSSMKSNENSNNIKIPGRKDSS